MDEHKGHETVPAAAERSEKQKKLQASRQQLHQRIQDREKDVKDLQQEVEAINVSADKAVEESEKVSEIIFRILNRSCDVKQQIRSQKKTEVSRVKDLQKKLEQEITDLKRREVELVKLSETAPPPSPSTNIRPLRYFEDVTAAVSEVRGQLQELLQGKLADILLSVTDLDVLLSDPNTGPEPKTRTGFLIFSQDITLDPNTAHNRLSLSDGNRKVTLKKESLSYSSHPDRFTGRHQVLSQQSLTGRCYWEVEFSGGVCVAVSYKNISRKNPESEFGFNDKSWSLSCKAKSYTFRHNKDKTSSRPPFSRVGVYLDHEAGVLSFYSISGTMTLLHRVHPTFTGPLYAGLSVGDDSSAEFVKIK